MSATPGTAPKRRGKASGEPGARGRGSPSRDRPPDPTDGERTRRALKAAARDRAEQQYLLRLYVTGTSALSSRAILAVREACETRLRGRYRLEVIDIYQLPALAKDHQIVATPTLIRVLPAPLRRYIGDLSRVEKVLFGLDIREVL